MKPAQIAVIPDDRASLSQMRLDRIEPSHYINLHLWCYACGCGGESHNYVADQDKS
jgi:hypothetical protein